MKKYLMMLTAAALIASAPIYYAMTAQAEETVEKDADAALEISIDCTKVTLDGEEVPEECKEVEAPAADAAAE